MTKKSDSALTFLLPVVLIILMASLLRARLNFSSAMIPGINGGYYPLLVRNLIEFGSVRYPDAPLVYWIQGGMTYLIRLLSGLSLDQSVLLASRLFDSIIPTLAYIPVFLHAREQLGNQTGSRIFIITISAFSVLYLASLIILSSEMQKNAAGLVWLACYIYSLRKAFLPDPGKKVWLSMLFLILIALTHIGCFAVACLLTLIYGSIFLIRSEKRIRVKTGLIILSIAGGIFMLSILILSHDPARMHRVLSLYLNPLRIFESPYLFLLLTGKQIYFGFLFHNFLLINALSISGLVIILINRRNLSSSNYTYALSLSALSLCLSSPLIGIEWALRYYLMAFLPIVFQFVYVYKSIIKKSIKFSVTAIVLVLTLLSIVLASTTRRNPAISEDSYADLHRLKSEVRINPGDLIVARHGLEWWTGWVLHCRTGKEYCLRPDDWLVYPNIYLLRQKKGNNYPGQGGTGQFAEFPVPGNAEKVSSNNSFDLYKLPKPEAELYYPGELPLMQGTIRSVDGLTITVHSQGYLQKVELETSTRFFNSEITDLKPGLRIDVWGKRMPFSLRIHAERVKCYPVEPGD
ncbi:MAG: hypothetical protein WCW62_02290 [Bacteroidales bacterium]